MCLTSFTPAHLLSLRSSLQMIASEAVKTFVLLTLSHSPPFPHQIYPHPLPLTSIEETATSLSPLKRSLLGLDSLCPLRRMEDQLDSVWTPLSKDRSPNRLHHESIRTQELLTHHLVDAHFQSEQKLISGNYTPPF